MTKAISMSLCHVAYFCKGWEKARGCRIELKSGNKERGRM